MLAIACKQHKPWPRASLPETLKYIWSFGFVNPLRNQKTAKPGVILCRALILDIDCRFDLVSATAALTGLLRIVTSIETVTTRATSYSVRILDGESTAHQ